jgi:hypothetical protein
MWLPNQIIQSVDDAARIYYVNARMCLSWNQHRKDGELRLLTGWCWISKTNPSLFRQGFKTQTVAYRDAYYSLVRRESAPAVRRLRAVA